MDTFNDGGLGGDDDMHIDDVMLDHDVEETAASTKKKVTGRGPSKPVHVSTPMFLEFDEYDLPMGRWSVHYGRQLGQCALRIDINAPAWPKVDQSIKDKMWAETKVYGCDFYLIYIFLIYTYYILFLIFIIYFAENV